MTEEFVQADLDFEGQVAVFLVERLVRVAYEGNFFVGRLGAEDVA